MQTLWYKRIHCLSVVMSKYWGHGNRLNAVSSRLTDDQRLNFPASLWWRVPVRHELCDTDIPQCIAGASKSQKVGQE